MKIYLAESSTDVLTVGRAMKQRPLRILLSYHYFSGLDLESIVAPLRSDERELDLFCDSGAFSAFTQGSAVNVDEYIAWVQKWRHLFSAVCCPDVIGDPAATLAGAERMIAEVPGPVLPTFHVGEPWEYLDRYLELSDHIALGGMVPYAKSDGRKILEPWCRKVFSRVGSARVHGFGCTAWKLVSRLPWYSVDSSSWTSVFRYGALILFDETLGRFETITMSDPAELIRATPLLETYGLRPADCRSRKNDRDTLGRASIEAWQRAEAWLTAKRAGQRLCLVANNQREDTPNNLRAIARFTDRKGGAT